MLSVGHLAMNSMIISA